MNKIKKISLINLLSKCIILLLIIILISIAIANLSNYNDYEYRNNYSTQSTTWVLVSSIVIGILLFVFALVSHITHIIFNNKHQW